ncbi:MAG: gliding motility-associated C-terminal domain-containing protein [Bacteroidia bacterium]|nr:gliding motility-associated C-terminal domain-containing protein [Bacteroidia bacterium]
MAPTQSQLIKLSNNGTVIWNKKLVNFVGNTIIIDSNNNFLVGGTSYVSGKQTPTLLKYSDSGDSLWRVNHSNSTNRNMLSCSIIMHNKNLFSTAVQSEKGNTTGYYLSLVLHTDSLLNILSIDTVNITKGKRVAIWDLMISKNSCNGYCLIGSVLDSAGAWGPRTFVKLSYNNIAEQRDVTTNPLMSKICIGDTVTLSSLWGIGNFSWSPSVGLSSATDSIVKAFPIVTTTYIVTSEVNGCIKTGAVKVAVVDIPQLSINVSKEILCKDHTGSATVMVTKGIGLYNYSWITGVNTDNTNPQYTIDNLSSGTYTVKVTDGNNCIGSGTITLIEPEAISNTLTIKDASCDGKNGNAVINTIGGTGVYTYSWSPFGSTSFEPRISNIGSGTYTLTIFDANGCTKTDTFEIKDNSNCLCNDEIFIPNIFSPNGDGKNDVLKIEGTGISNIYFAIYNRWGNLVYETYDQARGWDGTQRGNPCESGTYVYYLKGTCVKTNSEVNLKGNVSLIR